MYDVKFTPDAEADLARLSKAIAQRVLKKLRWVAENFETVTPELLTGDWQGVFKLRVGDYRALYTFIGQDRHQSGYHAGLCPNAGTGSRGHHFNRRGLVGAALEGGRVIGDGRAQSADFGR